MRRQQCRRTASQPNARIGHQVHSVLDFPLAFPNPFLPSPLVGEGGPLNWPPSASVRSQVAGNGRDGGKGGDTGVALA
jgi:hypothetical protein